MLDDDPLGLQLGRELDAFDDFQIGRVGTADKQPAPSPRQRNHLVLMCQLRVDDVLRHALRVHRR